MSASPTLNRAVRILGLITPRDSVDAVLRRELAPRRDLPPAERRGIVQAIAAYFRWLGWLDPDASPQRRVEAALALQARFDFNPAAIKPEALAARAVPKWLAAEMDAVPAEWLRQLQRDPPLWIRVRRQFADSLPRALGDCVAAVLPQALGFDPSALNARPSTSDRVPSPIDAPPPTLDPRPSSLDPRPSSLVPRQSSAVPRPSAPDFRCSALDPGLSTLVSRCSTAFRYTGARDLFVTTPFQQGQFEIQDLASQLVGHACAPSAGETWWDAFAGEGGKTLHLADLMQNKGLIWASDRSARRLNILRKRAARGGVFNYRAVPWDGGPQPPTRTRFDGVLVDAPCSGVGTWQRHPHARWTASPADVRELAGVQQQALDHVAASVKPGGRLIYSVCTLTRAETRDVVSRFSALHPEFVPVAVFQQTAGRKSEVRCQTPDVRERSAAGV